MFKKTHVVDKEQSSNRTGPRPLSRVIYVGENKEVPFKIDEIIIYLGEIPNMPGHCILVDKTGKIFSGYHIENFVEFDDNEPTHEEILRLRKKKDEEETI